MLIAGEARLSTSENTPLADSLVAAGAAPIALALIRGCDQHRTPGPSQREVQRLCCGTAIRDLLLAPTPLQLARRRLGGLGIEAAGAPGDGDVLADDLERDVVEPDLAGAAEHESECDADCRAWNVEHDLLLCPVGGEHERAILHVVRRLDYALSIDAHEENRGALVDFDGLEVSGQPKPFAAKRIGAHALREHRRALRRRDVCLDG